MFHSLRKISRSQVKQLSSVLCYAVIASVGSVIIVDRLDREQPGHHTPTPQNQNVSPGIVYESLQRYSDKSLLKSESDHPIDVTDYPTNRDKVQDSVLIELRELNNRLRMLDSINRTLRDGYRKMCLVNKPPRVSTGVGKIKSVVVGEVFDLEVFKE